MNRNLYLLAIVCFCTSIAFISFWSFNNLMHGLEFNEFTAFPDLVVVEWIVIMLYDLLLLKYFLAKKYKAAFLTSLISLITFMVLYTSVFTFFKGLGSGEFINQILTIHLIAVITFSLCLVLTKASERPLLKTTGYLGAVVGSIVLATHIYGLNLVEGETLNLLLNTQLWTSRLGDALILTFFTLNFYQELQNDQKFALKA